MEPPEFQGLLYYDGLDSLGRPVVVINADAVAEEKPARKAAFNYLLHQLEPVVSQVAPWLPDICMHGRPKSDSVYEDAKGLRICRYAQR